MWLFVLAHVLVSYWTHYLFRARFEGNASYFVPYLLKRLYMGLILNCVYVEEKKSKAFNYYNWYIILKIYVESLILSFETILRWMHGKSLVKKNKIRTQPLIMFCFWYACWDYVFCPHTSPFIILRFPFLVFLEHTFLVGVEFSSTLYLV